MNNGFYKKKKPWSKRRVRIIVLSGIFFAALLFYFMHAYRSMDRNSRVYANMGESKLPYVYMLMGEKKINPLHGYYQEMSGSVVRDSIATLPEDRKLLLFAALKKNSIEAAFYDIRSLDGSELIEKDSKAELEKTSEGVKITLPIQNLIQEGKEYQLRLRLDMGENSVYYYTRILLGKEKMAEEMLNLGESFTRKTFSKSEAKSLSTYLESEDTMDNSDLSHVNLHSSFQQITWGESGMSLDGDIEVSLKELSGIMGLIQLRYATKADDKEGNTRRFYNEDNFVMRYDSQRIYLMDFDRRTTEIFDTQNFRFQEKSLLLGVDSAEQMQSKCSGNKEYYAFSKGNALYRLNSEGVLTRIFTYLTEENNRFRGDFLSHGIRLMDVKDNGDVDFLVYGYISRGRHEGYTGIVFYTYDNSDNTVVENFFLPLQENKEELEKSLHSLAYYAGNKMFYLYYGGTVYGIDTNSFEVLTLASALKEGELSSSEDGQYLAYDEKNGESELSSTVVFKNLKLDRTRNISEENKLFSVIGFIENDLIIGVQDKALGTEWNPQGEIPVEEIRIIGPDQNEKLSYKKENLYFSNFSISGNQLSFDEYSHNENGYSYAGKDSILSNKVEEERTLKPELINSEGMGKNYLLPYPGKKIKKITVQNPEKFSIEKAGSIELNQEKTAESGRFFAYALGHYRGNYANMERAIGAVNENFGYILDGKQSFLWNRTDRPGVIIGKTRENEVTDFIAEIPELRNSLDFKNGKILNLYGVSLNSALYYTAKGYPLMIRIEGNWELITGYNGSQITSFVLGGTAAPKLVKKEEAVARYDTVHNAFFAFLPDK